VSQHPTDLHDQEAADLQDTGTDLDAVGPETGPETEPETTPAPEQAPDTVEVRRNGVVFAGVAGVATLVAAAYLARAASSGSVVDWLVCLALAAIAGAHALSWRDSRTPLLVADGVGIRVRLGHTWQGLPWEEIEEVEHAPRRGLLRDGRLVAFPVDPEGLVTGLGPSARTQALVSERVLGAPLAVPLGLTTRVSSTVPGASGLTAALLALAPDPAMVVEVVPGAGDPEPTGDTGPTEVLDALGLVTTTVPQARRAPARPAEPAGPVAPPVRTTGPEDTVVRPRPVLPGREPVAARRADVASQVVHAPLEDTRLTPLPASPTSQQLQRDAHDYFSAGPDDTGVWRSTTVVIDEMAGPALDPVIGPQLVRAREALGLSVERLSERTRIRSHVIEAIEVDDFEPCGGDFYARGHLRTLARVLGVDVTPMLAVYDERYADAPIAARTVFEADLATSSEGAIRSLRGGPNWSVLVAAVMAVVLAWSVVRLVLDQPDAADDAPSLASDSAGLTSGQTSLSPPVPVALTAEGGGAKVVVRDGSGGVVFKGTLAFGQSKNLKAAPPVRVQSSDGSLTVAVDGADPERMGRTGQSARATYVPDPD
jgi:cytoskeletal protein RodZ